MNVVSWCFVPCTLLICDLILLLIMFCLLLGTCPLLKNVWNWFFDTILINIWYIRGQSFLIFCFLFWITLISILKYSCKLCLNILCRFLSFGPCVNIFVSWCLVPFTLLVYYLIWLMIMFRLLLEGCLLLKLYEIVFQLQSFLISGTYLVTVFWFYASFSELHWYLYFLKI